MPFFLTHTILADALEITILPADAEGDNLKPILCPFCQSVGKKQKPFVAKVGKVGGHAVQCGNAECGCSMYGRSRAKAIKSWNQRGNRLVKQEK